MSTVTLQTYFKPRLCTKRMCWHWHVRWEFSVLHLGLASTISLVCSCFILSCFFIQLRTSVLWSWLGSHLVYLVSLLREMEHMKQTSVSRYCCSGNATGSLAVLLPKFSWFFRGKGRGMGLYVNPETWKLGDWYEKKLDKELGRESSKVRGTSGIWSQWGFEQERDGQ